MLWNAYLASAKWFHTFGVPHPVFLTRIVTPCALAKFLGSSVDLPSTEVHLNKSLRESSSVTTGPFQGPFCPSNSLLLVEKFLFLGGCLKTGEGAAMGDGDDESLIGEAGRGILALLASRFSFLLGEMGADWDLGYSIALFALLRPEFFFSFLHTLSPSVSSVLKK